MSKTKKENYELKKQLRELKEKMEENKEEGTGTNGSAAAGESSAAAGGRERRMRDREGLFAALADDNPVAQFQMAMHLHEVERQVNERRMMMMALREASSSN